MRTSHLEYVDDTVKFRQYAAGYATSLRVRLHNREGITEQERQWLGQFAEDPDEACQICLDRYALDQITARLAQHPT